MGTQGNGLNILSVSERVLAYIYSGLCGLCFVIVLMYPFFVCKITVSLFIFRFDMASDEKKGKMEASIQEVSGEEARSRCSGVA